MLPLPHRRPRRPHRQLDLPLAASMTPDAAPRWCSLPDATRHTLTGLLARLMVAHAAHAGLPSTALPNGDADEQ
jgi:hypothetical protein